MVVISNLAQSKHTTLCIAKDAVHMLLQYMLQESKGKECGGKKPNYQ